MQIKPFLFISIAVLLVSCGGNSENTEHTKLSDLEPEDVASYSLEIDQQLLNNIQGFVDKECAQSDLLTYDWSNDGEESLLDGGVIFKGVSEQIAYETFDLYAADVRAEGNYIFLTNLDFDEEWNALYDVVILPCEDQWELISLIQPNGLNYDISTEDILSQMKKWDAEVEFEVVVCDNDRVEAYMGYSPDNPSDFAQQVYDFCPDIVDQGYGDMESFIEDISSSQYFWMWWD